MLRVDHKKEHMGLLNRMVSAYLDFAESMTLRHISLTMQDWESRLNGFIEMFAYGLLKDAGIKKYLILHRIERCRKISETVANVGRRRDSRPCILIIVY